MNRVARRWQLQPLTLFAIALALWSFGRSFNLAGRWVGIDYYGSWAVGDALRTGVTRDFYDKDEQQRLTELLVGTRQLRRISIPVFLEGKEHLLSCYLLSEPERGN